MRQNSRGRIQESGVQELENLELGEDFRREMLVLDLRI